MESEESVKKGWLFLILSGLATGASWLCYYRAIQIGQVSRVVPVDKMSVVITLILSFVLLHEQFTWKSGVGALFDYRGNTDNGLAIDTSETV